MGIYHEFVSQPQGIFVPARMRHGERRSKLQSPVLDFAVAALHVQVNQAVRVAPVESRYSAAQRDSFLKVIPRSSMMCKDGAGDRKKRKRPRGYPSCSRALHATLRSPTDARKEGLMRNTLVPGLLSIGAGRPNISRAQRAELPHESGSAIMSAVERGLESLARDYGFEGWLD